MDEIFLKQRLERLEERVKELEVKAGLRTEIRYVRDSNTSALLEEGMKQLSSYNLCPSCNNTNFMLNRK